MGQLINLAEYRAKTIGKARKIVSGGGIKYWDGKKFCSFTVPKMDKRK